MRWSLGVKTVGSNPRITKQKQQPGCLTSHTAGPSMLGQPGGGRVEFSSLLHRAELHTCDLLHLRQSRPTLEVRTQWWGWAGTRTL